MKDMSISQPFILALALNNYDPFFGIKNKADINKMNDNIYTQVIDYMRISAQQSVLVLSGGEPFLDPRLDEILSLARGCGWNTSVDTWAGFGDQSVSLNQIQQVRLRLLSLNSEKHDKYICEKGNHRRTLAFIERLAKDFSGEKILVFPICRENMGEIHSILSWCQDYNFRLNMFIVSRQHKYALKHYEYLEVIRELCALPLQDIIIDTPLLGLHGWPNLCSGGRLAMFIDIDGGIKPCPYFPYPLFHIEEGLSKAWRNLQREIINLNVNCTSCSYFSSCGGGCLANKSNTGKEYYCPHNEAEEQLRK